ncbi:MAG: DUF5711 family protein [Defluviitaleaceae bacterium]|nr:DUF5711 family protein [Defluviitaleaceae bacterium]
MSKKGIFVFGILLLALAAVAQYTFELFGVGAQDMRMENTGQYIAYALDSNPSFHSNNSRFYFFTNRSGIRYLPSGGEPRWQETLTLTRPRMSARGDIAAVGEDGGRVIRVFNASGPMSIVSLDNPAHGFFINEGGDLCVIMAVDGGYHVHAFRRHSTDPFFRLNLYHRDNPMRFPIAADVSENGTYVAVAYLNLYRNLLTEVQIFSADRNVRFGTEALFAGADFPDETLIAMRFVSDNRILIITDRRVSMQSVIGNAMEEDWMLPLYNRLDQLAFCIGGRFAFVSGAPISPDTRDADPVGTVNIFDINGQTGRFYLGRRATHLTMGHNAVIVGADRYFRAINSRGASLWQHTARHDVRDILFLDNTNTVLIAGATRAYVWRWQRARGEEYIQ